MNIKDYVSYLVIGILLALLVNSCIWVGQDALQLHYASHTHTRSHTQTLKRALASLRSGDLLLCSGASWSQVMQRSPITHVAMAYQNAQGAWFAWETSAYEHTKGATLTPLPQFLRKWMEEGWGKESAELRNARNATLWIAKLKQPLDGKKLAKFIGAAEGAPYNVNLLAAAGHRVLPASLSLPFLLEGKDDDAVDFESGEAPPMFCSQLIVRTLMACGAMRRDRPSSSYLPRDFWDRGSLWGGSEEEHDKIWEAGHGISHRIRVLFPARNSADV